MVVFTMGTALEPSVSVIPDGPGRIVLSFTVMTYTIVRAMVNVWVLTSASVIRDIW